MTVCFLFFPDFETLDIFGPVEILTRVEGAEPRFVSVGGGQVRSRQGYLVDTAPLSEMDGGGILVVPGGMGTRPLVNDDAFLSALAAACKKADWVLSVCTGSALLAKAGLLDGRTATSNKKAFEWVRSQSDGVLWNEPARWCADGKYYTSTGVSAGMDMALGFVSDRFGLRKAEEIAKDIEYVWNRDPDAGSIRASSI